MVPDFFRKENVFGYIERGLAAKIYNNDVKPTHFVKQVAIS